MTEQETLSSSERIAKEQILVRAILEILGAPKEHINKSILMLIDKLKEKDDVHFISEEVFEAADVEGEKLFAAHAEVEFWIPLNLLLEFSVAFMPSSIEILEPSKFQIPCEKLSIFVNTMLKQMHMAEDVVKSQSMHNKVLEHKSSTLLRNFVLIVLKEKKTAEELSSVVGIPGKQLETFLGLLAKEGILKKEGEAYIVDGHKKSD